MLKAHLLRSSVKTSSFAFHTQSRKKKVSKLGELQAAPVWRLQFGGSSLGAEERKSEKERFGGTDPFLIVVNYCRKNVSSTPKVLERSSQPPRSCGTQWVRGVYIYSDWVLWGVVGGTSGKSF